MVTERLTKTKSFFLQCYYESIKVDLSNLNKNIQTINAPSLNEWLCYKEKLSKAMTMINIRHDIEKFLRDSNFKISLNARVKILYQIYTLKEDEDIETWMMKKLNNALWFNYTEISDEVNALILNNFTIEDNVVPTELFHGFKDDEMSISMVHKNILDSITKKLDKESRNKSDIPQDYHETNTKNDNILSYQNEICKDNGEAIDNIAHQNLTPIVNKNKIEHRMKKKRRRSVNLHTKISGSVIDFFRQKDTDNQLQLLKKLIILNLISRNNAALKRYMSATSKVSRETKRIILESIYVNGVEEYQYTLLDFSACKKYLIKQKVQEMNCLLKSKKVNLEKELEGTNFFCDSEPKFYEVLKKVSNI